MKGIPETSNSSWRLKYDRLRKDAIDSKDNKNKPTSTFDIAPKQTDGKPVQARQFMGKPIPQGRKKFPVKPRKTGVSGNRTGKSNVEGEVKKKKVPEVKKRKNKATVMADNTLAENKNKKKPEKKVSINKKTLKSEG